MCVCVFVCGYSQEDMRREFVADRALEPQAQNSQSKAQMNDEIVNESGIHRSI